MGKKAKDRIEWDPFIPADEQEVRRRRIQEVAELCPRDFIPVVQAVAGTQFTGADIQINKYPFNSHPRKMPAGVMGASVFLWDYQGYCMKIVKFRTSKQISRQYDPKISGSLARAVLKRMPSLGPRHVGPWIKKHSCRFDYTISKDNGKGMLDLLEVYLQIRLHPLY